MEDGTQENGATIDASGELDGHTFDNAWELAQKYRTIKTSQSVLTKQLLQYTSGHVLQMKENIWIGCTICLP